MAENECYWLEVMYPFNTRSETRGKIPPAPHPTCTRLRLIHPWAFPRERSGNSRLGAYCKQISTVSTAKTRQKTALSTPANSWTSGPIRVLDQNISSS